MTWKEHVTWFPDPSVAVYCTVSVPRENDVPGLKLLTRLTTPELSEAVGGVQVTGTVEDPLGRTAV